MKIHPLWKRLITEQRIYINNGGLEIIETLPTCYNKLQISGVESQCMERQISHETLHQSTKTVVINFKIGQESVPDHPTGKRMSVKEVLPMKRATQAVAIQAIPQGTSEQ